jgi:hypothetical protein
MNVGPHASLEWRCAKPSPIAQRLFCIFIVVLSVVCVSRSGAVGAPAAVSKRAFSISRLPRTSSGAELDRASGTGLRRLVAAHSFL